MAAIIKARTISSVVDNRIQISNASVSRKWSTTLGTSWTKIRIGCRISITDSGANITGSPRFYFGIQSGSNLLLSASGPTHWAGWRTNNASWTRTGGPPASYTIDSSSGGNVAKKIGTTLTDGSNYLTAAPLNYDATTANRKVLFLDITKGSPNFTFALTLQGSSSGDCTLTTYLQQVILVSPTVSGNVSGGSVTLAIDEATYGYFDSVGIAWDHSDALFEISDLTVVRFT